MSYCRFLEGDVYAYECKGGVQFYVAGGRKELDRLCSTFSEAYQYAKELRDTHGLDVPSHAIEALKADALEEAARICGPDGAVEELKAENAELRKHVKMPDEPLEIDEKDFYARAFIKWAIEEQPEVKRIEAENEKLRELVLDMWCAMWECNQYTCKHGEEGCYTKNGDNGGKCSLRDRMRELGVDTAKEDE